MCGREHDGLPRDQSLLSPSASRKGAVFPASFLPIAGGGARRNGSRNGQNESGSGRTRMAAWAAADPSINNGPDGDSLSHENQRVREREGQSHFGLIFEKLDVCLRLRDPS